MIVHSAKKFVVYEKIMCKNIKYNVRKNQRVKVLYLEIYNFLRFIKPIFFFWFSL
jgi:hypothetical protein